MNKYIKLVYEKLWCLLAVFYWVQLYEDYPYSKAFDENGKDIPFDNTDKDMIYNLTQILEDKLNEN